MLTKTLLNPAEMFSLSETTSPFNTNLSGNDEDRFLLIIF